MNGQRRGRGSIDPMRGFGTYLRTSGGTASIETCVTCGGAGTVRRLLSAGIRDGAVERHDPCPTCGPEPAPRVSMSPVCLDPGCPHRGHRTCPHASHHFAPDDETVRQIRSKET